MQKAEAKLSSLSAFFPCFNEEKNIPLFIEQAEKILPGLAKEYEIIIVNDGSKDRTREIANRIAQDNPHVRVVNHEKNRGYGAALKSGFSSSRYEWVFFTDGDLQFDLGQLESFIQFTDKYSVIIGHRKKTC